jgi:hypothetical protein
MYQERSIQQMLFIRLQELIRNPSSATWRKGRQLDVKDQSRNVIDGYVIYQRWLQRVKVEKNLRLLHDYQDSVIFKRTTEGKVTKTDGARLDLFIKQMFDKSPAAREVIKHMLDCIAKKTSELPMSTLYMPKSYYQSRLRKGPVTTKGKGKKKDSSPVVYSPFTFYHSKKWVEANPTAPKAMLGHLASECNAIANALDPITVHDVDMLNDIVPGLVAYFYTLSDQLRASKSIENDINGVKEKLTTVKVIVEAKNWMALRALQ